MCECNINREINHMKKLLEITAKQHRYDFNHPQVISLSQQLDTLIIKIMKEQKNTPYSAMNTN